MCVIFWFHLSKARDSLFIVEPFLIFEKAILKVVLIGWMRFSPSLFLLLIAADGLNEAVTRNVWLSALPRPPFSPPHLIDN